MPNQPKQPSIRKQIYITCCVLVALCLVTTFIGWLGQSQLLRNFESYESSENTLKQIGDLDQDVQELKARVEKYLSTGAPSQYARAIELQEQLAGNIDQVEAKSPRTGLTETLDEMRNALNVFRDQLKRASEERDLRTKLIQQDLPTQDSKVRRLLDELQQELKTKSDAALPVDFVQLIQSHADSRQWLQRYFIDPDSADYDRAVTSIKRSSRLVAKITEAESLPKDGDVQHADQASIHELGKRLETELLEFKRLGSRAFQATRGYMAYSNVVMAGEISEFVYYSDQLKRYVETQRVINRLARKSSATRARYLALFASLATVALAAFMATRLSYLIVSPIASITETFRRLGQGETVAEVPAGDRDDEIGRMARAAKIFSDKNQETRDLLARSEQLTFELANKAEALQATNEELDNFAYVASHDLKSPLRGIDHLATWVLEDCEGLLPEESRQHLEKMKGRVAKLENLLDDLLEYSRIGRTTPKPQLINVSKLVSSIASLVDTPKGFQINLKTESIDIVTLKAPLTQVLMNLITNGVKYNDKGEAGKIDIEAEMRGDFAYFKVTDNGSGIDSQYHSKIFEMYQRLATDGAEGSGMGLAIVKKQVVNLGGELNVQSNQGEGAQFSFTWPCGELLKQSRKNEVVDPAETV